MDADPKSKTRQGDRDRASRAARYLKETLDEALMNTFPASDPISTGQSTSIVVKYGRVKI
jgi:hypothetical protein